MNASNRPRFLTALAGAGIVAIAAVVTNSHVELADDVHTITGNTPGFVSRAADQGPVDPNAIITVTVWLKLHNESKLDQVLRDLYDPTSSSYRHWLKQDEFNAAYAPTAQELRSLQNFLSARSLSTLAVAENNFYVKAQGTVRDVQSAFHVQIHNLRLGSHTYRSNITDPGINDEVGSQVAAVTGMDDFGYESMLAQSAASDGTPARLPLGSRTDGLFFEGHCFRGVQVITFTGPTTSTTATYAGNRFGADISDTAPGHLPPCGYSPRELHTAYNLNPLYSAGLDGTGQTVVVTDAYGSPTIRSDAETFSQLYGLPNLTPENFRIFRAPGAANGPIGTVAPWALETTLDVEWVHAIAPGANIALVIGPTSHADLDEAINWAVIHHLGDTISNSWEAIEGLGDPAQFDRVNQILMMAAAEGIDVNFASGDGGDEALFTGFKTVDFPASSPFATGVGGTTLALNPDNSIAFQAGWGNNVTQIAAPVFLGGIPLNPPRHLGFQAGSGGGASAIFTRPFFQNTLGLPGGTRLVPDVAWLADPFTGAEFIQTFNAQTFVGIGGGTSLACPMFSALMAIAAQQAGHALGQAAQSLYRLPTGALSDIVPIGSANNVAGAITTLDGTTTLSADQLAAPLNGTTGYYSALLDQLTGWFVLTFGTDSSLTAAPGWDDVTGLGTPNGPTFVSAMSG